MPADATPGGVTEVISREIRAGREKEYDEWFRRMLFIKRGAPGYLGTTVISPAGANPRVRYIVSRFRDAGALDSWRKAPERARLLEQVQEFATPYYDEATGLETWFGLPGRASFVPPPRWKIALITFGAAAVVNYTLRFLLGRFVGDWGLLLQTLLFTALLVVFLLFFVLPGLTRLLQGWLYPARPSVS